MASGANKNGFVHNFIHWDTGTFTAGVLKRMETGSAGSATSLNTLIKPPNGFNSLQVSPGKNNINFYTWPDAGAVNTGQLVVGQWFYFAGGNWPVIALDIPFLSVSDGGSGFCWELKLSQAGNTQIVFTDAAGTTSNVDSVGDVEEDTWYFYTVVWEHANSDTVLIYRGDTVIKVISNVDTIDAGNSNLIYRSTGQEVVTPTGIHASVWVGFGYALYNGINSSIRMGPDDFVIKTFDIQKNSVTPDFDQFGNAPGGNDTDGGVWKDFGDDDNTTFITYNQQHNGGCVTDDPPGEGPKNGGVHVDDVIMAGKWTFLLDGASFSQVVKVLFGAAQNITNVVINSEQTTIIRANKGWAVLKQFGFTVSGVPSGNQWAGIGIQNTSFLGDVIKGRVAKYATLIKHPRTISDPNLTVLGETTLLGEVALI